MLYKNYVESKLINVNEIKNTLLDLLNNGLRTSPDVNNLANYCLKIAKAYLKTKNDNLNYYTKHFTLEEIALDSIVGLFQKNNKDGEYIIIHSFNNFEKPIKTNSDAQYFLHYIVWKNVEQQLTKVYNDIDPFFGKILSSIKYIIKTTGFYKQSYFGIAIITETKEKICNASIVDKVNFDDLPSSVFLNNNDVLISKLLDYLKNETEFYPAIPLNLFVKRLKNLRANDFLKNEEDDFAKNFEEIITVENAVKTSLDKTYSKLELIYSGKYTREEFNIFRKILKGYSDDLKNGGISNSLYEYFNEESTGINSDIFYSKYHNTLYYLVNELKKSIRQKIKSE